MSMEQAILELAGAIRELAKANAPQVRTVVASMDLGSASDTSVVTAADESTFGKEGAAPPKGAVVAAESNKAIAQADAELEKAVTQVEEAAKETPVDDGLAELSYTADVRPVLLKLNKAKGADTLKALLKKFGAATGDKLTADQFVAVLADANAQLAA